MTVSIVCLPVPVWLIVVPQCGASVWCMEACREHNGACCFPAHILDMQGEHCVGTMGSRCDSSATISCCLNPPRAQVPVPRPTEVRSYEWAAVRTVLGTLHRAESSELLQLKQNIWSAVSANLRRACQVLYFHAFTKMMVEKSQSSGMCDH